MKKKLTLLAIVVLFLPGILLLQLATTLSPCQYPSWLSWLLVQVKAQDRFDPHGCYLCPGCDFADPACLPYKLCDKYGICEESVCRSTCLSHPDKSAPAAPPPDDVAPAGRVDAYDPNTANEGWAACSLRIRFDVPPGAVSKPVEVRAYHTGLPANVPAPPKGIIGCPFFFGAWINGEGKTVAEFNEPIVIKVSDEKTAISASLREMTIPAPPQYPLPPSETNWRGEYYDNTSLSGSPVLVRADSAIDFDWGTGSPALGVPADNFSARWTQSVSFASGTYRFTVRADDGIRLWLDDILLIDQWHDSLPSAYQVDVTLTSGTYPLRMEYYEQGGGGITQLSWEQFSGHVRKPASAATRENQVHLTMYDPATATWVKLCSRTEGEQVAAALVLPTPLEEGGNALFALTLDNTPAPDQVADQQGKTTLSIPGGNFKVEILPGTVEVGTYFETTYLSNVPDNGSFRLLPTPIDVKACQVDYTTANQIRQVTKFSKPLEITFGFDAETLTRAGGKGNLTMVSLDDGQWADLEELNARVVRGDNALTAGSSSLGGFSLAVR